MCFIAGLFLIFRSNDYSLSGIRSHWWLVIARSQVLDQLGSSRRSAPETTSFHNPQTEEIDLQHSCKLYKPSVPQGFTMICLLDIGCEMPLLMRKDYKLHPWDRFDSYIDAHGVLYVFLVFLFNQDQHKASKWCSQSCQLIDIDGIVTSIGSWPSLLNYINFSPGGTGTKICSMYSLYIHIYILYI